MSISLTLFAVPGFSNLNGRTKPPEQPWCVSRLRTRGPGSHEKEVQRIERPLRLLPGCGVDFRVPSADFNVAKTKPTGHRPWDRVTGTSWGTWLMTVTVTVLGLAINCNRELSQRHASPCLPMKVLQVYSQEHFPRLIH